MVLLVGHLQICPYKYQPVPKNTYKTEMKPAYETICYCETYKQTNFPLQRTPQKSSCAVTVSSLRAIQLLFHSFDCVDEMRDLPLSAWRTAATRAKCCVFVSFITKSHSCHQSQQLWEAAFSVWQTRCCKMKRLQWIVVPPCQLHLASVHASQAVCSNL